MVLHSFRDPVVCARGLEKFFTTGSKAGIPPKFEDKLRVQLGLLNVATTPNQLDLPGYDLHPLKGELEGHWAIKVNANWRLTFRFIGEDAEIVNLQDYH